MISSISAARVRDITHHPLTPTLSPGSGGEGVEAPHFPYGWRGRRRGPGTMAKGPIARASGRGTGGGSSATPPLTPTLSRFRG